MAILHYRGISDDYLVVWFGGGKVYGITTYKNHRDGLCGGFFRNIKWENAVIQLSLSRTRTYFILSAAIYLFVYAVSYLAFLNLSYLR